jgi:hypothetical protein
VSGYWTSSGPAIDITTTATLSQFTDKVEGLARVINRGASSALITVLNAAATKQNLVTLQPLSESYIAFGVEQQYALVNNSEDVSIQPGYAQKGHDSTDWGGGSSLAPTGALIQRDGQFILDRNNDFIVNVAQS